MAMKFDFISRAKFFFQKRVSPINKVKFDLKSMRYGYRKLKHAEATTTLLKDGNGLKKLEPIDMHKKQHIHVYLNIQCGMDCYFCQNAFYVDKLPRYDKKTAVEWAGWLNKMYNFHHIDFNGGEALLHNDFVPLMNMLNHHNITVFTNMPKSKIEGLKEIKKKGNNITLSVSYHPLEEKRDINEFVDDFNRIPKWLNPTVHLINIPEVSYKNIRAAFVMRGVFIEALDAIIPTEFNRTDGPYKTVMCRSDMDCISPEMNAYRCTGLMLKKIGNTPIERYEFNNDHKKCNYYGLCGPCTSQRDILPVPK